MRLAFLCLTAALIAAAPARAVEIDFATKLVDLDGNPYRECVKATLDKSGCVEWLEHTLGIIAYGALDRPETCPQGQAPLQCLLEQARRAALARKVYPGRDEKHVLDLSASEVTLIVDQIAKISPQMKPTETLQAVELLDPARLKDK